MPHSISEKNTVCQSMLSFLGITDLTTGAVRLGEIQLHGTPGLMCGVKRLRMLMCSLEGESHSLTGNICFNLLQYQHNGCGRKPVVTVWVSFLKPGFGLRSALFGQAAMWSHLSKYGHSKQLIGQCSGAIFLFKGNHFPSKPL